MIKVVLNDLKTIRAHLKNEGLKKTWEWFHSRDAPGIVQFTKYVLSGFVATFVQLGIVVAAGATFLPAFEGLVGHEIPDETREWNLKMANLLGFPFANLAAYYINTIWVFTPGRHSKWKEFWLFTLVSSISFGAGLFGGPELIGWFGIPSWAAQLGFMVTSALVNFVCRKFLIFLK